MNIKSNLTITLCLLILIFYSIISCKEEEKNVVTTDQEVTLNSENSSDQESYRFITKWGSKGNKKGQFKNPVSMALNSKGIIYVVDGAISGNFKEKISTPFIKSSPDTGNYPVQKFDLNGNYKGYWEDDNSINNPMEITIDLKDNVYIIDHSYGYSIKKFTSNGKLSKILTLASRSGNEVVPLDIAINCNDIYVSSYKGIYKFDSSGNFITNWIAVNSSIQVEIPESIAGMAITSVSLLKIHS